MTSEYATFGLVPAMRAGGVLPDGTYRTHRDFLDFEVNGSPPLPRLADLDAVTPLASDLGPTVFADQIRGLLLETEPPLDGGRYVLYGCPECEGPACGMVTAVIACDGPDIVWRDVQWQTDRPPADPCHGIGPYRFHGEQYRALLERLLRDPDAHDLSAHRRVLLVGSRAALFAKLAAALRRTGIGAEITLDAVGAHVAELRRYAVVFFGRTIRQDERDAVRDAFARARSDAVFITGLAPIVPLLVAQVEQALDPTPPDRRLIRLAARNGEALVEVASECRVRLAAHRLDRLSRPHTHPLHDAPLPPGLHRLPLPPKTLRGESYLAAHTTSTVLTAPLTP
ncbi:oxidoreductase [Streptomyces sp. NPDC021098]|uniref:oxidoreductase n=1 Tax=unclassified Streptomyces TaxID=2593676 RepID=UPI0037A3A55C